MTRAEAVRVRFHRLEAAGIVRLDYVESGMPGRRWCFTPTTGPGERSLTTSQAEDWLHGAEAASLDVPTETLGQGIDPVQFVVSANISRRHLTPSQRAAAVAQVDIVRDAQAKAAERKAEGNAVGGKSGKSQVTLPETSVADGRQARDELADMAGVSAKTMQDVLTATEHGADEEARLAILAGKTTASSARKAKAAREKAATEQTARDEARDTFPARRVEHCTAQPAPSEKTTLGAGRGHTPGRAATVQAARPTGCYSPPSTRYSPRMPSISRLELTAV